MERQHYYWTAGGATVSVALAAETIAKIRDAAVKEASGAEIGGLLLGTLESEERITIDDFELLQTEHRRGFTFTLSRSDRTRLEQRLRARRGRRLVVGCFRTHLRPGLYMDQYDFDLMSGHFASATDVMLLIRPSDWRAGFFVWEDGDVHRQKSYLEFPFDPAMLATASAPMSTSTGENPQTATETFAHLQQTGAPDVPVPVETRELHHHAPSQQVKRTPRPWLPGLLPVLGKAGIALVCVGLLGLLAYYAHGHHNPTVVSAAVQPPVARFSQPPAAAVNPPVDPDARTYDDDRFEVHVKVPVTEEEAAAPEGHIPLSRRDTPVAAPAASVAAPRSRTVMPAEPPPAMAQPIQTASNLPSGLAAAPMLKPTKPNVVSEVSLEPSEPGLISRSINHVPVLNLFQRHRFRAGDRFSPAKPLREVKPNLPAAWEGKNESPSNVDVKVWIDKNGQVIKAELLSDGTEPELAELASNAAYKWTFEPARVSDNPVSSEMVMHFRFVPTQPY